MKKDDIGLWSMIDNTNVNSPERVIYLKVKDSDQLKENLNELSQIIAASNVNELPAAPAHLREYYNALNTTNVNGNQLTGFIADKRLVLKIVYNKGENDPESLVLSADAITALESINVPTIDLQDMKAEPFTFSNANVKRVILPDGWNKASVTAAGEAIKAVNSGFEVALSQDDANYSLVAYVNKPGSLYLAMRHTFYDGHGITKLGTQNQNTYSLDNLKYLTLTGSPAARDFNGGATDAVKFDENGHFVFDREADETSTEKDAGIGGTRKLLGTKLNGAIVGAKLTLLDLEDAIITDEWNSDLTISWSYSAISTSLKEVRFPTTPLLKTLPADCLNGDYDLLEELCIPGNIEVLKTRACYISTNVLRHVWTTGSTPHMVYDNGAYMVPAAGQDPVVDHYGHASLESTVWNAGNRPEVNPRYGTITLPENLKLIESHNFTARSVSDVYVLSTTAPECHVDAFSTIMYMGNNTIDTQYILDQGMVTRQAYAQSVSKGEYITFLHYPRTVGTPNTQRYTDPTREYSVATTLRDGKGNVIYFPNQSELNRAYLQGTTGYLWYAWDYERVPGPSGNENSFANLSDLNAKTEHTTAAQEQANSFYLANNMSVPGDEDLDKTTRTFYDVRLDSYGQPTLTKPADLEWYYDQYRSGKQLYPEAKSENSDYIYIRDDNGTYVKDPDPEFDGVFREYTSSADDALERYSRKQVLVTDTQGKPVFEECTDGNYVQDYEWVVDDEGGFIRDIEITSNDVDGEYALNYTWEIPTDGTDGTHYHPLVLLPHLNDPDIQAIPDADISKYYFRNETRIKEYSSTGQYGEMWGETGTYDELMQKFANNPYALENIPIWWEQGGSNDLKRFDWVESVTYTQATQKDQFYNNKDNTCKISDGFVEWSADATDYVVGVNDTRYSKVYATDVNDVASYHLYNQESDEGASRFDIVDNGYVVATSPEDDEKQHYDKNPLGTYHLATAAEAGEQHYCLRTEDLVLESPVTYTIANDYRGWHQFILTAYATNDDRPFTPIKFYQTDNDWWTVCLPYDLKYNDMIKFFGNETTGAIPYLSKLRYVVRDYDKEKITLMFSKNLMEYKEVITNPSATDDFVHGVIDDKTPYTQAELAANPIILHKGVPYLIRPNIPTGANRQFDIYLSGDENANPDLYQRLVDAQNVDGGALATYIYKGEYTVPAYVIGENAPEATTDSRSFTHQAGPTFSYSSSDKIVYGNEEITASISSDFSYTFVGSFFLSLMPQHCYFLGWDSNKKRATFWYNRVAKADSYDWNNQTGIICPNFNTSLRIDPASSLSDPAKWTIKTSGNNPDIECDDLIGVTQGAKTNTETAMEEGGAIFSVDVVVNGIGKINTDDASDGIERADVIYDLHGVRMNQSLKSLPKGIYIVNGKKYVVK